MKFGVQLFGILKNRRDNTMETLRALRQLGFSRIEPCLSLEPIPGMEHVIWPIPWFEAHWEEICGLGLEIVSAHIFTEGLAASAGEWKRLAEKYHIGQFIAKLPQDKSHEVLQQAALSYMQVADTLAEVGAMLLLHNEGTDIQTLIRGKTAYEYLLELCLGKVGAQVDVGWVYAGGQDPETLLWRLGSLVKSLHYKDFHRKGSNMSPAIVGSGDVDLVACFQFARAMGIPQIVDQDVFFCDPLVECGQCLEAVKPLEQVREHTVSYLNTLDVETGEVRTLRRFEQVIEAPNWLKEKERILFNGDGSLYAYNLRNGTATRIDTGLCDQCNNDHALSPDEQWVAVSHNDGKETWASRIYVLPVEGGKPRLVTPNTPSFLHGWSPDGGELAYCAFREHEGKTEVDVYAIPVKGGKEVRLTQGGFNDGPEYSPDGRYIWFNSTRTGLMQIWRMNRDGSEQRQMTFSRRNNWFPHLSPDGRKVAYLSYREGDLEAGEHLPNMQVELWCMNSDGSDPHWVVSLFGGQGSLNVNSWAKDSRHLAFVSYELLHK